MSAVTPGVGETTLWRACSRSMHADKCKSSMSAKKEDDQENYNVHSLDASGTECLNPL